MALEKQFKMEIDFVNESVRGVPRIISLARFGGTLIDLVERLTIEPGPDLDKAIASLVKDGLNRFRVEHKAQSL